MQKAFSFIVTLGIGMIFGAAWVCQVIYSDPTNECRRVNNVYACKLIAVPDIPHSPSH